MDTHDPERRIPGHPSISAPNAPSYMGVPDIVFEAPTPWRWRYRDLRVPPGNRLEALKGGGAGRHSIRVNDQFRVCFRWTGAGAEDVEIVDYH